MISPVGFAAENASDQFAENPDAQKKGSMADTLIVMSASAMGAGAITACTGPGRISPSSIAFIAGSLIYLLGEISSGKAQKDSIKKRSEDLKLAQEKMAGGGDAQKMALEEALKEQEETLKFIKKRKAFMTALSVAWVAAAGLAILENFPLLIPLNTQACPALKVTSIPWIIAIEVAWISAIGFSSGQPLGALLAPFAIGAAVAFIPAKALPATRAVIYSASAVFAMKAAGELGEKEKVIEKNISMLKKALGQFEEETSTDQSSLLAANTALSGEGNDRLISPGATTSSSTATLTPTTAGNTAAGASNAVANESERTCASTVAGKVSVGSDCSNPLKLSATKPQVDVPALQMAAQTATDMSNSMSSGNIGEAEVSAASLSSMAANVEAGRKTALNLLNNRLQREGKPQFDLDGETKKAVESMSAGILETINKGGAPLMAALGASNIGLQTVAASEKIEATPDLNAATVIAATPVAPQIIPAPELAAPVETKVAQIYEKTDSLENYELETSDISSNKETTIWQQVTNRYQNNYGRFFERKKLQTP